jgi:hypothetical protein
MFVLQVVEGHNKVRLATVRKNGIRYRGTDYQPLSLRRLDQGSADDGSSLAGAAAGTLAFGAAGAIAGSIVGGGGRTAVLIKTAQGPELICTVASRDYAALYVEIKRLTLPGTQVSAESNHSRSIIVPLLLGPLYFLRVGFGWFILAISLTVLTYGLAWPMFSLLGVFSRHKAKQRSASTAMYLAAPVTAGDFGRTERDFFEAPERGSATP